MTETRMNGVRRFEEIRAAAVSEWESLKHSEKPYVMVGTATCGRAAGALDTLEAIGQTIARLGVNVRLLQVGCMGHCYAEPLVIISKPGYPPICYAYVTSEIAGRLVEDFFVRDDPRLEFAFGALEENDLIPTVHELPRFQHEFRLLLHNCGYIDPENINHYIANGGYSGLSRALRMSPEEIIEEIRRSGLRGRGGAGFPTGRKWELCRRAPGSPKYLVCNADEGDPGAFMDRALLESDPQSVIEGMVIAGYAIGISQGYVYVRAEYPLAVKCVENAIRQAEELGLLGDDILGSGFSLGIEVVQGAGAFVCGESTALTYSIEGRRGMPRVRPPHSIESGLWGKPTVLNNVKTFATIPHIITKGAEWFAGIGTENSKGTAVFALAGRVLNPGLVEVPMGTSLRQIISALGGGVPGNRQFKAVQIGGPSGGCLPESLLDTPVDFDSLVDAGAMMGSGGMVILDEDNCMVDTARYFLDFTQNESCGKCTMCRLGTKQMLDIIEDITRGKGKSTDLDLLIELAEGVKSGSLCGLGKTAPNPVLTTTRYFREEYEAHIIEKRCPGLVCKELIAYYIDPQKCDKSCEACIGSCSAEAIFTGKRRKKVIDQSKCIKCGVCVYACPPHLSAVVRISPAGSVPGEDPGKDDS
ncbi:SLBB domain-containing protein [Dehalococcoidia bacterium]|nr:SLBB domain-containing protein [Dehalococcoidia bacterium]